MKFGPRQNLRPVNRKKTCAIALCNVIESGYSSLIQNQGFEFMSNSITRIFYFSTCLSEFKTIVIDLYE